MQLRIAAENRGPRNYALDVAQKLGGGVRLSESLTLGIPDGEVLKAPQVRELQ